MRQKTVTTKISQERECVRKQRAAHFGRNITEPVENTNEVKCRYTRMVCSSKKKRMKNEMKMYLSALSAALNQLIMLNVTQQRRRALHTFTSNFSQFPSLFCHPASQHFRNLMLYDDDMSYIEFNIHNKPSTTTTAAQTSTTFVYKSLKQANIYTICLAHGALFTITIQRICFTLLINSILILFFRLPSCIR